MLQRRYAYIGESGYKTFTSFRKMCEWARNPDHEGIYYISAPDVTFTYARTDILGLK